jgi:chloramphenicol 3-O phosphotransferase
VIWERREATWGQVRGAVDDGVRCAVELGQRAAREHRYDLQLDTSLLTPDECAEAIRTRLAEGPSGSAFEGLIGA